MVERQQRHLGRHLVVVPSVAVSVITFWVIIPIVVGLVLITTSLMRVRADQGN